MKRTQARDWSVVRKHIWNQSRKKSWSDLNRKYPQDRSLVEYRDRKGRSIPLMRWGTLHSRIQYKIVIQRTTRGGHRVSTVWLGLDHSMPWTNQVQIFETMIFCQHDGADERRKANAERIMGIGLNEESVASLADNPLGEVGCELDGVTWRYSTEKAARKNHNRVLQAVYAFERGKREGVLSARDFEGEEEAISIEDGATQSL